MALQVWLPLNGTLENKGLANIKMASINSPVYTNEGKIGKAIVFLNSTNTIIYDLNICLDLKYTDNFSYCMWVKDVSEGTTTSYLFTVGRADMGSYGYGIRVVSPTQLQFRFGNWSTTKTIIDGQWNFIAFTKKGNVITFYINGTTSTNTFSGTLPSYSSSEYNSLGIGCFHHSNNSNIYPCNATVNDFRIYDHALSAKEVKEISKGLVLHYSLDDEYMEGTTNILSYSNLQGHGSSWTLQTETFRGTPIYKNVVTSPSPNIQNNAGFSIKSPITPSNLNTATEVTLSFYKRLNAVYGKNLGGYLRVIRSDSVAATYVWSYNKPNWANDSSSIGTWEFITATVTIPIGCTSISLFYVYTDYATGGDCDFAQIQLELKDHTTPYVNGTRTGIVYDSSGYCNHGSIIGTLTTNSDSPRYIASTMFDGSSTIEAPFSPTGPFTISGWFYHSSGTSYYGAKNTSWTYICLEGSRYFLYGSNGLSSLTLGNYTSTANTWLHIVLVYSGSALKLYINGIYMQERSASNFVYISDILNIGGRLGQGEYVGRMSDFRIYATALSEDDIKELYNTSAFVTDNGVFAEYELYEDNLSDVKKRGLLETANFYENGAESGYALDTDKTRVASNYIISEDFIEI